MTLFRNGQSVRNQLLKIWFVVGFLFLSFSGMAQQVTVSGTVSDPAGEVIPGANVIVKGTTTGVVTDIDGKFSIAVPGRDAVLVFSFIGYTPQEITVGANSVLSVILAESSQELEEVVVVGYGTMKKKDLTGASVSVGGKEIANIPVTTAAQALTGKAAGVNVVTQSGAPGAEINILVRGGTSITQGSEPLYVVDGFLMEKGLQNVDINDIESIDVMKDASSTAIYGARGSNGVILITTKSGKSGKTEISYNAYFSIEKLDKQLDLMGLPDYVQYQYELQALMGKTSQWASMFGGDVTAADFYTGAYSRISNDYGSRSSIDWQDLVFGGSAFAQNHNVNVTGGNEKTKFMVSYNYTGQNGILDKSGYNRNSIRAKLNHELAKWARLDLNTSFQNTQVKGGGSLGGMLKMTILQPPTGGVMFTDDQLINDDVSVSMQNVDSQYDVYNPIITNDAITQKKYTRLSTTNIGLEFDFLQNFTFRTAGSYMWRQTRDDYWDDGRTKTAQNYGGPYGKRNNSEKYSWQITNTLTWKEDFGKHGLNVMLGQETFYDSFLKLDNEYHGFPVDNFGLDNVAMGTPYAWKSDKYSNAFVSFFGRIAYNYDNRYLITGVLRSDGTSKFAKDNKWGVFPSVSGAWRISEESFMKNQNIFNNLKLRVGYGTTGNCNIFNNMYVTDYSAGTYAIGNKEYATLIPGNIVGNPHIQWESTTSTNIGLDVSVLNSRISLGVDFYNNKSDNLLIQNRVPLSTGFKYQFQNIGSVRNRGVEILVNSINIKSSDFVWTTSFNIAFNRSKVLSIYGESDNDYFLQDYESRINTMVRVGDPIGQFYGYNYAGVYTTDDFEQLSNGSYRLKNGIPYAKSRKKDSIKPGDVKYSPTAGAVDGDGSPTWSADDRTVIGCSEPKFTGGMTNTFTYKNFDLSVFFNFSYGNKIFNMNTQRFIGPYLPNQNTLAVMGNRFTLFDPATGKETKDLARLAELNPQQHSGDLVWSANPENKIAISDALDYYLEDGSFLRLNTITLGYTLPRNLLSKLKISNLRVYCTLNNIYTFTNYTGYDPEVAAASDAEVSANYDPKAPSASSLLTRGIDNSAYPRSRSYVFGLNLTF